MTTKTNICAEKDPADEFVPELYKPHRRAASTRSSGSNSPAPGDYTNMSEYYDVIMTSGYYDYKKIADSIFARPHFQHALEIGCGTGLILEEMAGRDALASLTGVDLTGSMINIAARRLQRFPAVSLVLQNITQLQLDRQYDLAFSYGGVWYFVVDGDREPFMVSHLSQEADNHLGLARLGEAVCQGGRLLLGAQGPHTDYEKTISNGMVYSQKIEPMAQGFTKHYFLADRGRTVMAQTLEYRTYTFTEALQLLAQHGFQQVPAHGPGATFLEFVRA